LPRHTAPFEGVGIAYMLQGDMPVSNTDPFATVPTAGNEWLEDAQVFLLTSDTSAL
jgi:hypothetical protein